VTLAETVMERMITGVEAYPHGIMKVVRQCDLVPSPPDVRMPRKEIKELTTKARRKMLLTIVSTKVQFYSMITLTYGESYPTDGLIVKEQFKQMRDYVKRRLGAEYFWFLEFQARGAPHAHILTTYERPDAIDRLNLAIYWANVCGLRDRCSEVANGWGHSGGVMSSDDLCKQWGQVLYVHSRAGSYGNAFDSIHNESGAIKYVAKYATKVKQKCVPPEYQNVGRWWGCSSEVRKNKVEPKTYQLEAVQLRGYLNQIQHTAYKYDVLPSVLIGVDWFNEVEGDE
jgi:hypothetical protein